MLYLSFGCSISRRVPNLMFLFKMQDIISRHLRICAVFLGYDFFQESIFSVFFNVAIKRGFAVLLAVKKVHVNGRFLRLINSGLTLFRIIVRK